MTAQLLVSALVAALLVAVSPGLAQACTTVTAVPASTAVGGSCQTYNNDNADGSLAFCAGIVNYPYYLPQGASQAVLDNTARSNLVTSPTSGLLLSILPPSCSYQIKKVVCTAAFQACELVDPFFVDANCGVGGLVCTSCGTLTPSPTLLNPAGLPMAPTYGSICFNTTSSTAVGDSTTCSTGPGKVPGYGNIGWVALRNATAPTTPMAAFCLSRLLVWSEAAQSCMVALPRSPCKGECEKLWSMDKTVGLVNGIPALVNSICPIVSGVWSSLLTSLQANPDPYVANQSTVALAQGISGRTNINLLAALGLAPACNGLAPSSTNYLFGTVYTQETQASNRAASAGLLIAAKAAGYNQAMPGKCHCVSGAATFSATLGFATGTTEHCDSTKDSSSCGVLATRTARCNSLAGTTPPNPSLQFVDPSDPDMLPQCKDSIRMPNNNPPNATLDILAAGLGISRETAMGAFFVAPSPGFPELGTGSMSARPLCAIPNNVRPTEVFRGYNSYQCATAAVKSAAGVVPPILGGSCRLAFLDMLCNTAHMKLEFKNLCLVPSGGCSPTSVQGAADNLMPFTFALPRFPSKHLCTNFKTQCSGFLTSLGPIGTTRRDAIEAAFNCNGPINQSCQRNNPLDQWNTMNYPCNSSLNGLPAYPAQAQGLANLTALLEPYAVATGLVGYLSTIGGSQVTNQSISDGSIGTLSTCSCPFPLVVPEDPNSPGNPAICCQQRCEGHMYTPEQSDSIVLIQKIASPLSLAGTLFIIATWGTFRVKRSQPLTFFFAVASANVALTFIIPDFFKPDVRDVWCKDNTQPNTQKDGGMCLFQSIWLTYWVMAACTFWLVQGFDLFLRIVYNQRHLDHLTKYYHLFAWGYPMLVLAIMLGNNAMGYESTYYWCFLRDIQENENLNRGLDLGLFYGSIITIWASGACLMAAVLYRIYTVTSKNAGTAQVTNSTMKRLAMYRTPVFFVIFFVYVWVSIFAWRFDAEAKKDKIKSAGLDWASCLLTNFAAGITNPANDPAANNTILQQYGRENGTGCGSTFPVQIRFSDYIYLMCIANLQGVFIFFIFGAKVENFNLWKEKLGLTTKKYDTTAEDSSTKEKSGNKPTILSQAMSSLFAPHSPAMKAESTEKEGGGSAVMVNGLQSGKFIAVTEPDMTHAKVKSNQVAAAYMSE